MKSFTNFKFNPISLNPILWLNALMINGDDGDAVSIWRDDSGNNRHAYQTNNIYKPTLKRNILNGKPVVRFDGVGDWMVGSLINRPQPITIFSVINIPSTNFAAFFDSDTRLLLSSIFLNQVSMYAGGFNPTISYTFGSFVILQSVFNGSSSYFSKNNESKIVGNPGSNSLGTYQLGRWFDSPDGQGELVDIAEILVFDKILKNDEEDIIKTYLNNNYRIF